MSGDYSEAALDMDAQLKDVMGFFQEHREDTDFDPLPTLTRIAEILEWANDEYFLNNPDPLDVRHPTKVLPNCILGLMLKHIHKATNFFEKCTVSYLMPHDRLEVNVTAARVLVSALPVLDEALFTVDIMKELFRYALHSPSRELKAYSTILLNAGMSPEKAHIYRLETVNLIIESLAKLRRLYAEMVEGTERIGGSETADQPNGPTDFSILREKELAGVSLKEPTNPETPTTSKTPSPDENAQKPDPTATPTLRKRPAPSDDGTDDGLQAKRARHGSKKERMPLRSPMLNVPKIAGSPANQLDDAFNDAMSTCSVDDMRNIIVGDNTIYPLTIGMEQRMILQFLQSVCQFTDHLSLLTEHNALEVIMKYLNVKEYNDTRLLFEAVYCLGTMLIHLRLAWEFVNRDGLSKLITVNRKSVAAASVCVCLHHISHFSDIMEHICQSPGKMLDTIVNGYESCGGRICGFFGYALQFKVILERFEHADGLRILFNYVSSRLEEYLNADPEGDIDKHQERISEYCAIMKNTCTVLQQYLSSHILLKCESLKRHNLPEKFQLKTSGRMSWKDLAKKPLVLSPETEEKALELLMRILAFTESWHPANALRTLGFFRIFLTALNIRFTHHYVLPVMRADTLKFCLNIMRCMTVDPGVVKYMCEVSSDHPTGLLVILGLIESDIDDSEMVKLALQILVHCCCGPERSDDATSSATFRIPSDTVTPRKGLKTPRYFFDGTKDERNGLLSAWQCAQQNNAIMILISFIREPEPNSEGDAMRAISCRALTGLARYEPVRQILSRHPLFANNGIALLLREPLLPDKHAEHAEFQKYAKELFERVHQTKIEPGPLDLTFEKHWKASVVKQTKIKFDDTELLRLIQDHFVSRGLEKSAKVLELEAGLGGMGPSSLTTNSDLAKLNSSVDGSLNKDDSLGANDILTSFPSLPSLAASSRSVATVEPTNSALVSLPSRTNTPVANTNSRTRGNAYRTPPAKPLGKTVAEFTPRRSIGKSSLLAQTSLPFSSRHQDTAYSMFSQNSSLRPQKSLSEIVTEYFRQQHASCEKPIVTCPPFSFYYPHRCLVPRASYQAPLNIVERFLMREALPYRRTHQMLNRRDRNTAFSHYYPARFFIGDEEELLSACQFSHNDDCVLLGMFSGDLNWINTETAANERQLSCHSSAIGSMDQSPDGQLLLTSSLYVSPLSALWRLNDGAECIRTFEEEVDLSFSKSNTDKIVGTILHKGFLFDTETGELLMELSSPQANEYQRNRACFNFTDTLILNDGLLWDLRMNPMEVVHKFDKLSSEYWGAFHPNGSEVLICSQVWDLRNYHLLKNVTALEHSDGYFNASGDILFSITRHPGEELDERLYSVYDSSFSVIDSHDYHVIATVDTKKEILAFSPDHHDRQICIVERSLGRDDERTVCRIYEIGRLRGEGEIADEDEEEEDVDLNNGFGEEDDEDDEEIDSFNTDSLGDTSDDSSEMSEGAMLDEMDDYIEHMEMHHHGEFHEDEYPNEDEEVEDEEYDEDYEDSENDSDDGGEEDGDMATVEYSPNDEDDD